MTVAQSSPHDIAAAFVTRWAQAWNGEGPGAAAQLYTQDGVLVGAATGIGRPEIERLLGMLYNQGWTTIRITVVHARAVGDVIVAACEFTAHGSGPTDGKTLDGKSSHVLTRVGDTWLSAMHTAA